MIDKERQEQLSGIQQQWNQTLSEILEYRSGEKLSLQLNPANIVYRLEEITRYNLEKKAGRINFLILAAPTGGGKTTIGKELEKFGVVRFPRHVTRQPRPNEIDGQDYNFISMEKFKEKEKAGDFIQISYTYGEGRGTDRNTFFDLIKYNKKFYIDGSARTPLDFIDKPEMKNIIFASVCFLPPTFDELIQRLLNRVKQDKDMDEEYILKRMQTALKQLEQAKTTIDTFYVNDEISRVVKEIKKIL